MHADTYGHKSSKFVLTSGSTLYLLCGVFVSPKQHRVSVVSNARTRWQSAVIGLILLLNLLTIKTVKQEIN